MYLSFFFCSLSNEEVDRERKKFNFLPYELIDAKVINLLLLINLYFLLFCSYGLVTYTQNIYTHLDRFA